HRQEHAIHHVVDITPGANLRPVSVNLDGLVAQCLRHEPVNGSFSDLSRAIDIERPQRHRWYLVLSMVGVSHVLAGQFTYRINPAGFADCTYGCKTTLLRPKCVRAEDLARRKIDKALQSTKVPRSLQRVECPDQIDSHGRRRTLDHRIDPRNGCHVNNYMRICLHHRDP